MKMKSIKILQLQICPEWDKKVFWAYDSIIKRYGEIDLNEYECVYEGEVPGYYSPEDVYMLCNLNHPEGYRGHSLSVSDIIVMDGKELYVDRFGFIKL